MKKNNNKGFMLLETMVVSAFIITVLIFLYVQFSNLKKSYDESFRYDTIPELFKTKEIDKFINNNYGYADIINDVKESEDKYIELYNNSCNMTYFSKYNSYCNRLMNDMNVKTILLVSTDLSKLINKLKTNNKYSNSLYLYIKKINQSTNNNSYSLIVEFNDKKYTNLIVQEDKVTVTFDANGGTVSTESKEVKPGETYGTLPTPTREGFTFKGWNGKNLYDYDNVQVYTSATEKITIDGVKLYQRIASYADWGVWPYAYNNRLSLVDNKKYTMSFDIWSDSNSNMDKQTFYINKNTVRVNHNIQNINTEKKRLIATFTYFYDETGIFHIYPSITNRPNYYIANIQIEEGETATEYEPYYITSSTKVVQDKDHTLKAIWEQNS